VIRSLKYSLPIQVSQHIALVHPITHFPRVKSSFEKRTLQLSARAASPPTPTIKERLEGNATELIAACQSITPGCIAALYNIDYTPPRNETPSGSSLGVAGFLEQYINHTDVDSWVRKYGVSEDIRANPGTFDVELVNGGTNNESYYATGVEATLDMEYSMPFVGSLPVTYYSVGGRPPALDANGFLVSEGQTSNEPYLELLTYLLAKPDGELPHVLSISYTDTEQSVPRDYALYICQLFGQLAARGVSVIDASGDGGVAGQNDMDCTSNDAAKTPKFLPTFPASCPYVTAVGWTYILPEEWGNSRSSGGFSDYFEVPEYQKNSTAAYIATLDGQYSGLYNATGRGIPDLSLYGSRYETENNNVTSGYHSGTSAGTPVIASMIALVNDIRLRKGLPVLGWLNPLLYSVGLQSVFNDVVLGNSYGCGESWNATVGWDAVTGLGSVDFARLASVLG
jgi:tripeptidyl-peptidase-1